MCMVKRLFLPVVFLLSFAISQILTGSGDRAQPFVVSTEWLAQHLSDPKLVLIDCFVATLLAMTKDSLHSSSL